MGMGKGNKNVLGTWDGQLKSLVHQYAKDNLDKPIFADDVVAWVIQKKSLYSRKNQRALKKSVERILETIVLEDDESDQVEEVTIVAENKIGEEKVQEDKVQEEKIVQVEKTEKNSVEQTNGESESKQRTVLKRKAKDEPSVRKKVRTERSSDAISHTLFEPAESSVLWFLSDCAVPDKGYEEVGGVDHIMQQVLLSSPIVLSPSSWSSLLSGQWHTLDFTKLWVSSLLQDFSFMDLQDLERQCWPMPSLV
jgi:hypothetical protein